MTFLKYTSNILMMKQQQSQQQFISPDLQNRIDRIYDHLYANSSVRTPNGIGSEVGKALHAGIYMEGIQGGIPAFNFTRSELNQLLRGHRTTLNSIAEQVRKNFMRMNKSWKLYEVGAEICLDDFDLCFTCAQLNGIVLSDRGQDILGEAVEVFRSQWAKRIGGQFFTDPRVTALSMVLLEFDPRKGDDLIDICAGTGGFLLAGLNHIRKLLEEAGTTASVESELVRLACKSLRGQEVDHEVCEAANSTMKARLGVGGSLLVSHGDSLEAEVFSGKSGRLRFGSHLCAASNPPFGTKITIKDPATLRHFELAKSRNSRANAKGNEVLSPQPPDILFLERNVQMLKPGAGRLAIVLPYQLLSGPKTVFVREWILRNARIKAVVDLPPETFQPYTGTKTALLVVERMDQMVLDPRIVNDYDIFMSMPRWIGHDRRGNPVYQRTLEGKVTNEILSDFNEVEKAFKLFLEGKDPQEAHRLSFKAKFSSIAQDPLLHINALFHRPPSEVTRDWNRKIRASDWISVKLRDVVKDVFCPGRFKRNYVDYFPGAVPFLGGSNITEFIARTDKWLSPDDPNLKTLRVYSGWILITRSGTTGIVSSVPKAWNGFAMSEHVIRVVPEPDKVEPEYLLAFLRSEYGQEQLARGVFGSVIDEITPGSVGDIQIHIPTSKKNVGEIVKLVRESEEARQSGIENYMESAERLNDMLSD